MSLLIKFLGFLFILHVSIACFITDCPMGLGIVLYNQQFLIEQSRKPLFLVQKFNQSQHGSYSHQKQGPAN